MPNTKTLPARVKAVDEADDSGSGIVEALVATYDVDSIGDRIVPGAFAKSLDEWTKRADDGERIPFIWSHMHDDLDAYLGDVIEARETDEGLWVRAQLDMDDPKAAKAFRLIKGGRVRNYSFAYEVVDAGPDEDGDGETALRELKLFEVGPTLIGMNQNTRTLVAKRADELLVPFAQLKVGRTFSARNEKDLRDIRDGLSDLAERVDALLAQLDDTAPDDEEPVDESSASTQDDDTQPAEPVKREEPTAVKREEPMTSGPVDDDLRLLLQLQTERN